MHFHALHHCGLDCRGNRHVRLKSVPAIRASRHHAALRPRMVIVARVSPCRTVWRTGLQRARWEAWNAVLRAERRSFQCTLPRPPLVSPLLGLGRRLDRAGLG